MLGTSSGSASALARRAHHAANVKFAGTVTRPGAATKKSRFISPYNIHTIAVVPPNAHANDEPDG